MRDTAPQTHYILDCDGVMLDWESAFGNYVREVHGLPVDPRGPESYDLRKWLGCLTREDATHYVEQFAASPSFSMIPPLACAVTAVKAMVESGAAVSVLTSCGGDEGVIARRTENIVSVFGDVFETIRCIPLGESKLNRLNAMAGYGRRNIWVEDNYANAVDGLYCGCEVFMVRCRHNLSQEADSHREITWVDTLAEAFSLASRITENV